MTENELKQKLTPEQYKIMREGGTEAPFSGKYWNEHAKGMSLTTGLKRGAAKGIALIPPA